MFENCITGADPGGFLRGRFYRIPVLTVRIRTDTASNQGLHCLSLTKQFNTRSQVVEWTCWREVNRNVSQIHSNFPVKMKFWFKGAFDDRTPPPPPRHPSPRTPSESASGIWTKCLVFLLYIVAMHRTYQSGTTLYSPRSGHSLFVLKEKRRYCI